MSIHNAGPPFEARKLGSNACLYKALHREWWESRTGSRFDRFQRTASVAIPDCLDKGDSDAPTPTAQLTESNSGHRRQSITLSARRDGRFSHQPFEVRTPERQSRSLSPSESAACS
jgi:hypothetical protein